MTTNKYSFKKTFKKFWMSTAVVVVSGLIVVWQEDPKYMVLIPFLVAGLNWLKHRKG